MGEVLSGYEIFSSKLKMSYPLTGLYAGEDQKDCFGYNYANEHRSIHISQILYGDWNIVYNKSYILKSEDVLYLFKDLGGQYDI